MKNVAYFIGEFIVLNSKLEARSHPVARGGSLMNERLVTICRARFVACEIVASDFSELLAAFQGYIYVVSNIAVRYINASGSYGIFY